MPHNPWAALDPTDSPAARARALRRIWEDFLHDGRLDQSRPPISESWRRSRATGFDPSASRAPSVLGDRREAAKRWEEHPLAAVAPLIRRWLGPVADASGQLMVVSDADGVLLWEDGDLGVRAAAADTMNFVEGALWSESGGGTNGIGTALATDHAVQVHGAEHLSEAVHGWTCAAVPVHDPVDGRLLGIIDLSGPLDHAHPRSVAAVLATARAVEAELRVQAQMREARDRISTLDELAATRGRLAVVTRTGRVIADPDGLLDGRRVELPVPGGVVTLPDGRHALAEPLDDHDAYLVRPIRRSRGSGAPQARPPTPRRVPQVAADQTEWRQVQLALSRMAEEQAALRRVATLVAGQTTAEEIFAVVAEEVARLFRADRGVVCRYEADGSMTVTAYWTREPRSLPVGTRVPLDGDSVAVQVQQSGRASRIDDYAGLSGPVLDAAATLGPPARSTVGAPILVDGTVWGVILQSSTGSEPFPLDTESRLTSFAELVATAISNAVTRAELHASRARLMAASDQARRRIERDLHDSAQQRLASLVLELRTAVGSRTADADELRAALARTAESVKAALKELQEVSRGIHPRTLSQGGLAPALRALGRSCALPIVLEIATSARFAEPVEVAGYYAVSELLANAVKHSGAGVVRVGVKEQGGRLCLTVRDDGAGGADAAGGSGLVGVRDRVETLGGTLVLDSPPGGGTVALVSLPLG
jgi:signal transduction histidine kinase